MMGLISCLTYLLLLSTSTLAQFEGYDLRDFEQHQLFHQQFKEPVHHQQSHEDYELDYHAHPKYAFDYSVKDPHTGDDKEHWETRDGDKVKGTYTVIETDGTKRVVEYEADDKNGFNAVVHRIGTPKEEKKPLFEPKPHFETLRFHQEPHDFQQFDDGFVPVHGGFDH